MFDSKKWLILFFALALIGSIGGSLVAYLILDKKQKAHATPAVAPVAMAKEEAVAPVEPATPPAAAVKQKPTEQKPTAAETPGIDETVQPDFPIMSRAEWKARPPALEMKPQRPSVITIHHSGVNTAPDKSIAIKVKNLQDFSQHEGGLATNKPKPIWPDIPYHFYIDINGEAAECRDINFVGESNTDYDATGHVLIALEGNFEKTQPTKEQMETLFKMVSWLSRKYNISADKISSHRAFASTACPGKNLESRLDEIRRHVWKN